MKQEVAEEFFGWVDLVQFVEPPDGVVGHRGHEVPRAVRLALEGINLGRVAEEIRLPLVGVAAHESVEVFEAHAGRPLVEWSGLTALEGRCIVILTEPRGRVTVVRQDATDGGLVLGNNAVIAGKAGGLLGDDPKANRVMIAPGDERGARG